MAQPRDNISLLNALQAQYHHIVNLIATLRMGNYRPKVQYIASAKLAAQLRDYIKQASAPKPIILPNAVQENKHPPVIKKEATQHHNGATDPAKPDSHTNTPGEQHSKQPLLNTAGDKLMQSTWEHLHASIRSANAGDKAAAKLHASIMDSALKEAAHFLDDEVYQEFVQKLGEELNSHNLAR